MVRTPRHSETFQGARRIRIGSGQAVVGFPDSSSISPSVRDALVLKKIFFTASPASQVSADAFVRRIYAHMQAVGMVNDHLIDCFRYRDVRRLGRKPQAP